MPMMELPSLFEAPPRLNLSRRRQFVLVQNSRRVGWNASALQVCQNCALASVTLRHKASVRCR